MGGNALKNVKTRRYNADEYYALEKEVVRALHHATSGRVEAIKAYRNKESFGDMDVLVESEDVDYRTIINDLFRPNEIVKNGSVYSFDYKELQIDLILMSSEVFETAKVYYSYNDINNLCGRIAKKQSFSWGHEGLKYVVRDGDYQFKKILVSRDIPKIFKFMGYDYDRFLDGFDDLEDIFKYVATSPYFHKDIFLLHNRNHKARIRDAKRKTYHEFLVWLETAEGLPEYEWKNYRTKCAGSGDEYDSFVDESEKELFMTKAFEMFDGFEEEYHKTMKEFEDHKEFKRLYNGELVSRITGLEGKELGMFMRHMKDTYDIKSVILGIDRFVIDSFIQSAYHVYSVIEESVKK